MSKTWFHEANCFLARYKVDPRRRAEFLDVLDQMFACAKPWYDDHANFAFHGWARDPDTWVVIASWKSEEILEALRNDAEWQRLSVRMLECCSEPMVFEQFSGMKVDRSVFDQYPAGASTVHPGSDKVGAIVV